MVEIGGQCWMQENIDVDPAGAPNNFSTVTSSDIGDYAYYSNTYQAPGEGTLFQWSAAMNGSTAERAQGVCPDGWHIPSDCELMYLENTMGMSTTDQSDVGWRGSILVTGEAEKLKSSTFTTVTSSVTDATGMSILGAGARNGADGVYFNPDRGYMWSSTETGTSWARHRIVEDNSDLIFRSAPPKYNAWTVRCLKD